MEKNNNGQYLFTKEEITEMADRCYRRCWHCDRYEPHSGSGSSRDTLFSYSTHGCYEAHDLPWVSGQWCPFWGNKNHPDAPILRSLTWANVIGIKPEYYETEPSVRQAILEANPDIAERVQYCDNSNESREQYFNKSENWALLKFEGVNVYCETLRRYRFSLVDSRTLYPGANEWVRPLIICFDPKTYKILTLCIPDGDGVQISFACNPKENYRLNPNLYRYDENKKCVICEFKAGDKVVGTYSLQVGAYV